MNRFRNKRRAKEAAALEQQQQQQQQQQQASEPSPIPALSFMKGKKKPAETKPDLDLSSALPSSDDFRTSLLMPKMSARFSMLRDQDDPNSIMGKAKDDSVIVPRRQSRLNLYGHTNQLADISEVSSLSGSGRPSLAVGRSSFASGEGYATDEENSHGASIMNRSRPGEGNNLFGGRQKVYKIPMGGSSTPKDDTLPDSGASGSGMGGKAIYENDVTLSAFQKMKQREREQKEAERLLSGDPADHDTPDEAGPVKGQENRTSASTTSADSQARASTQESTPSHTPNTGTPPTKPNGGTFGGERNPTKSRRLYGQGLELNSQPSSAINRIESINRQRAATNDISQINRSQSRSAVNLSEKFQQKTSPLYASSSFRPTSPPPSAASSISGGADNNGKKTNSGSGSGLNQSHIYAPLSPPVSETDEVSPFAAALQPEDRGKATATGLFNKPASKYDDDQFTRRQLQMYQGRNTPPLRRPSPPRTSSGVESSGRARGLSGTSYQSKTDSAMTRQDSQDEPRQSGDRSAPTSIRRFSPPKPANGTFLANFSGSESDGDADDDRSLNSSRPSIAHSAENIHPAFRTSTESGDSYTYKSPHMSTSETKLSDSRDLKTIEENETGEKENAQPPANDNVSLKVLDSPTLGPSGPGLSGLIRTHLRQGSDRSSVYPPPSPGIPLTSTESNREYPDPPIQPRRSTSQATTSVHSNPFEYDDWAKTSQPSIPDEPVKVQTQAPAQPDMSSMSMRAKQMLGQATALSAQGRETASQRPSEPEEGSNLHPDQPLSNVPAWESEQMSGHNRAGSSETQMDREEFANELAERRRKVQEKLRGVADSELRSRSPGMTGDGFPGLKPRMGRNTQPKHMRILGIESPASPNLASKESRRDEGDELLHDAPRSESPNVGPHPAPNRASRPQPHPVQMSRGSQDEAHTSFHDDSSASHSKSERRDRPGSESSSGRSKSRPRYRDDLQSVEETIENQIRNLTGDEQKVPGVPGSAHSSSRPSVESSERGHSMTAGGRFRSNSRPVVPTQLDTASSPSMHAAHPAFIGNSPRPSPAAPYSANTTPPLFETSPAGSPASTPTHGMSSAQSQANQRNQGLSGHKRPVDKSQISEPRLVSSTNNVPTIGLPPGASLSNGSNTPPIPPMNPRRRQTTTQTFFGAFKSPDRADTMPSGNTRHPEEQSTFSDEDKRSRPRQRLRKISSEGGNLNSKVRHQALSSEDSSTVPPIPKDGGMF